MHRIIKTIFIFILAVYCCLGVVTILHWGVNVCPFYFATFTKSEIVPIVCGLPTWDMLIKAKNDKIILGVVWFIFFQEFVPIATGQPISLLFVSGMMSLWKTNNSSS